jgi:hypothetical protein
MTRASNLKDIHLMSTVAFCNSRFEEMLSNAMHPDNFAYNAVRARQVSVMFLLSSFNCSSLFGGFLK